MREADKDKLKKKNFYDYVERMQKSTNAKTNCNKQSASNNEIDEDHVKDGRG